MNNRKKNFVIRSAMAGLLLAFLAVFILYYKGSVALPFVGKRVVAVKPTGDNNQGGVKKPTEQGGASAEAPKSNLNVADLLQKIIKKPDRSVVGVVDSSSIPSNSVSMRFAGVLASEGYLTSNLEYNGNDFTVAKMKPNFDVTDKYSLRNKTLKRVSAEQVTPYGEFEAVYTDEETPRPAIELYMGYIIVDDGETLSICNRYGQFLTTFDDGFYIPAYTRDSAGNPLFYRNTTAPSGLFDGEVLVALEKNSDEREDDEQRINLLREPHEKDKTVFVEGKVEKEGEGNPVYEEVKAYYRLSDDGSYFASSGYNDISEGRGLYFDYPAYYGLTDSGTTLAVKLRDSLTLKANGETEILHDSLWAFARGGNVFTEYEFKRAYNFNGGLACVVTEPYYKDGGLYFVNGSGNRAFKTTRQYQNNMERYVIENLVPPVSSGPESIGHYYYDHGLVRVRRETLDSWNYTYDNLKRYLSSEEILIDAEGNEFPIPAGYNIKAYSNGMILLEKDGLYGFMNYTGKWIAEPVYSAASYFSEGLGTLKTSDGRTGVIDTSGNIVVPFEYDYISPCSDGVMAAYHPSEGWQILRKMSAPGVEG